MAAPSLAKRSLVFFGACVSTRLLFAVVAAKVPLHWLPFLGALALVPAVGFMHVFLAKKNRRGAVFKGPAWWDGLRPVHSLLYLAFAVLAMLRVREAWMLLVADVMIGVIAFTAHYSIGGELDSLTTGVSNAIIGGIGRL